VDLPTYTNIWRIEKRLYKLYDFRLPMPLPLGQIAVFTAIVVPYVVVLALVGVPFSHTLLWLYLLPPGVLTWFATRPVLESKRLPELVASQLRYLGEPRTWCRMAPLAEPSEAVVAARVWRCRCPADADARDLGVPGQVAGQDEKESGEITSRRSPTPSTLPAIGQSKQAVPGGTERVAAATAVLARPWTGKGRAHAGPAVVQPARGAQPVGRPTLPQASVGQKETSPPQAQALPRAQAQSHARAWPQVTAVPHSLARQQETARQQELPRQRAPAQQPAAALSQTAGPQRVPGRPESTAVPRGPARPEAIAPSQTAGPQPGPVRPQGTARSHPPVPPRSRPIVTVNEDRSAERPVRMVERALGGPAERRAEGWRDRVVVVPGGHRPGQPDQQQRDRARARLPVAGSRRIVVLGCTVGAGQSVTTLRTGELLASLRDEPVAVLDLNPGKNSLSERARVMPALVGESARSGRASAARARAPSRLEIITSQAEDMTAPDAHSAAPGAVADAAQIFELLAARYALTLADPAASAVPRVLSVADQLLLVAPASSEAAGAIAMTMEWLEAHGHARLAEGAITVLNGVSKHTMTHVEQAEAVAVGRCRAIIRVPWDDQLKHLAMRRPGGDDPPDPEHRQDAGSASASAERAERAYTALAGVLVASLAAAPELPRAGLPRAGL
jgi:MinD-like ATPase involved in chromosome partitioning or flagellar assembly